jgi:hypothetical protein
MNLISLLKIDVMVLNEAERRGLLLAEELWKRAGEPIEPQQLVPVLEVILQQSRVKRIRYPPVLLLRKKELHRKLMERRVVDKPQESATDAVVIGPCSLCRSAGVVISSTGITGTLCPNGCFLKRRRWL